MDSFGSVCKTTLLPELSQQYVDDETVVKTGGVSSLKYLTFVMVTPLAGVELFCETSGKSKDKGVPYKLVALQYTRQLVAKILMPKQSSIAWRVANSKLLRYVSWLVSSNKFNCWRISASVNHAVVLSRAICSNFSQLNGLRVGAPRFKQPSWSTDIVRHQPNECQQRGRAQQKPIASLRTGL